MRCKGFLYNGIELEYYKGKERKRRRREREKEKREKKKRNGSDKNMSSS